MEIFIVDGQKIAPDGQNGYAHDRVLFSLARFAHRISGATVHLFKDEKGGAIRCSIEVSLDCTQVISADRRADSLEKAVNAAVEAIEPKVGRKVDWRGWLNAESLATFRVWLNQFMRRAFPMRLFVFTR